MVDRKDSPQRPGRLLWALCALAWLAAIALALRSAAVALPPSAWWSALVDPDTTNMGDLLLHYSIAPRFVASLLVGAGLTVAATLFQSVLRNPAADSSTLGISAGAFLALSACSVWLPAFVEGQRTLVAALGGTAAGALVLSLSWRSRFDPKTLLLAGLLVNLYASALNTLLILYHGGLIRLFIWESGSLAMQDWTLVRLLLPNVAVAWVAALLLSRPLTLLAVSDGTASSLGLSPSLLRRLAVLTGIWLTAVCVAAVGVIGFVGLAAPEILRRLGNTSMRSQLLIAPLLGAGLLSAADGLFQWIPTPAEVPAGAAMALLGAPLLLWISTRREMRVPRILEADSTMPAKSATPASMTALACLVILFVMGSVFVGRGFQGWSFGGLHSLDATLFWRGPRLIVALSAGIMLAVSGVLVQRLTANPMASPELLGISSGAALAVVAMAIFLPAAPRWMDALAAGGGSLVVLLLTVAFGVRHAFSPQRIFVVGLSIATFFSAVISILLASGDPRMYGLLNWLSGSTYLATPADACLFLVLAVAAVAVSTLVVRWLDILPFGTETAQALGVSLLRSRLSILLLASVLVGASVLAAGPLSFVGLMAPHLARIVGARRALPQLMVATIFGGLLMAVADFVGRVAFVPRQLPAGLAATLIGGAYVIWLMRGRRG
ncbi:MAG: Fe(3+)-hydroxamate ABC transporter permease FhuB [Rhizobiaceae bacterium]|nr:Fe(3+)-hydroxamate ABC transporter permease FhuB [Rhizobiaceae bacterium]